MAIDCIDINLDETPEGNTGDWWDSPLGWDRWLTALNSRGDKDLIHICCDAGRLRDRLTYENTYQITAFGSSISRIYVMCGNIGSRFESSVSQDSWWFVGSRPDPMRRQEWEGVNLLEITSDYISIEGIKAKNYADVMEYKSAIQDSALMNCIFQNANYGARFRETVTDMEIDSIVGKNITKSLLMFHKNVTNTTISNITSLNANIEDGEAIGIRFLGGNNQNVKIRDVVIGGQHDHYVGSIPKNPYHDKSEYAPYTQGEALAIEGGAGIEIDRFFVFNTTDRLIDCKAQCVIRDSGGSMSKRGITMWAADSHAINCVVKSSVGVGNTPATAYLLFGNDSTLEDCSAFMLERRFKCTVIVAQAVSIKIIRGEYIQPPDYPFIVSGSGNDAVGVTTVELIDVEINGKKYNRTLTFQEPGSEWVPD